MDLPLKPLLPLVGEYVIVPWWDPDRRYAAVVGDPNRGPTRCKAPVIPTTGVDTQVADTTFHQAARVPR